MLYVRFFDHETDKKSYEVAVYEYCVYALIPRQYQSFHTLYHLK